MTSAIGGEKILAGFNMTVQSNGKQGDAQDAFNKVMQSMTQDLTSLKSESAGAQDTLKSSQAEKSDSNQDTSYLSREDKGRDYRAEEKERVSKNPEDKVETRRADEKPSASDSKKVTTEKADNAEEETSAMTVSQSIIDLLMQLQTEVTQVLDTEVGDMVKALNDLDLTAASLLNPESMQKLMLEITGEEEASLLTNEDLYGMFKELSALADEASAQIAALSGMDEQDASFATEWEKLTASISDSLKELQISSEAEPTTEEIPLTAFGEPNEKGLLANGKDGQDRSAVLVGQNEEPIQVHNKEEAKTMEQGQGQNDASQGDLSKEDNAAKKSADALEEMPTSHLAENREGDAPLPLFAEQMENAQSVGEQVLPGSESMAPDTQEIMKQIVDYMRTMRSGEMSEVEMQLHPSELGTLHINVASKNGLVTAQFAAENEAVKQVIEAQLDQLKENLSQTGVKIEAVEVTVSSHEFERNLEQEAHQEETNSQNEKKSKNLRRINLDFDEEGADIDIDEAESITRDMMMRRGGSLDYQA